MRRWHDFCSLVFGAAVAVSQLAFAQQPATGAQQPATGPTIDTSSKLRPTSPRQLGISPTLGPTQGQDSRSSADVYTEARSREMFTACDGDSDDRLDLFEACEALETLGTPKDSAAFERLDRNRDGYLTWPEFDQHFRSIVQRGGTLRVKTCRRLVPQAPEQQQALPMTPLQRFVQTYDKNGNGGLDPSEVDDLVKFIQLPPVIGTGIKALDLDLSGRIEETELAPFFDRLRGSMTIPGLELPKSGAALPATWAPIDANSDGVIDTEELARALRRLDPTLARWAKLLLLQFDHNKDGSLDAAELPDGTPATAPTATTATKS